MADTSWDTYTENRSTRGMPKWLKILLGLAVGFAVLVTLLVSLGKAGQSRAWPTVRRLGAALQSDETARILYGQSPRLKEVYPDAETFLAAIRPHRPALATLPETFEPARGTFLFADPGGGITCRTFLKNDGVMHVTLRGQGLFGPRAGVTALDDLTFATDAAELRKSFDARFKSRHAQTWAQFRQVALALEEDGSTQRLWSEHPGLRDTFGSEQVFLDQARRWRAIKAPLPEHIEDAKPPVGISEGHGPFRHQVRITFRTAEGPRLTLTWEQDKLARIAFSFDPQEKRDRH